MFSQFMRGWRSYNMGIFDQTLLLKDVLNEKMYRAAKRAKVATIFIFICLVLGWITIIVGGILLGNGVIDDTLDSYNNIYPLYDSYNGYATTTASSGLGTLAIVGIALLAIGCLSYIIYFCLLITNIILCSVWKAKWKDVSLQTSVLKDIAYKNMVRQNRNWENKQLYSDELFNLSMQIKNERKYFGWVQIAFWAGIFFYGILLYGALAGFIARMSKYIEVYETAQVTNKIADDDAATQQYRPIGNTNNPNNYPNSSSPYNQQNQYDPRNYPNQQGSPSDYYYGPQNGPQSNPYGPNPNQGYYNQGSNNNGYPYQNPYSNNPSDGQNPDDKNSKK